MKILYVTDIHGDHGKYWQVLEVAREHGVDAVVNGGDMLPKGSVNLHSAQKEFVEGFLDGYFAQYEKAGIYHLGYLGNDDLRILDAFFEKVCSRYPRVVNLAQKKFELETFEFIGMNWVADYPFRLKDRCRKDQKEYQFQRQFGSGLFSTKDGYKELDDWFAYAQTLPTIEEELRSLPKPKNPRKAIYVIHMPPAGLGLDVCQSGEKVGSKAIYEFIEKTQPLLTLHGHIHESPTCSGVWRAAVGKTVCVQPGQLNADSVSYAFIDLSSMNIERSVDSFVNRKFV